MPVVFLLFWGRCFFGSFCQALPICGNGLRLFCVRKYIIIHFIMAEREYIIAAAVIEYGQVWLPPSVENANIRIAATHTALRLHGQLTGGRTYWPVADKGFLTSRLRFVNRWQAMQIARAAGQIGVELPALFSDLLDLRPWFLQYLGAHPENADALRALSV